MPPHPISNQCVAKAIESILNLEQNLAIEALPFIRAFRSKECILQEGEKDCQILTIPLRFGLEGPLKFSLELVKVNIVVLKFS